ncbi:hypothetical protein Poli38472_013677 [Pythium oligandrum]|uniref:Ankyrin repeat-containing domain n=1 Tax=Pythium oligandrum TaxID=41045 RepID=A0A8K1FHP0_PYTOL|nr:hypothetical protein Poli38472_013677 [Pythium oligandrum]|eukprot:TMW61214.1 hypothetical protein Poli38472_013677 [Pythium oligandrum]
MTSMTTMTKRKRMDVVTLDEGLPDGKKAHATQETSAAMAVVGNPTLLRLVTSYQRGIPLVFPSLTIKHGITRKNVEKARENAVRVDALSKHKHPYSVHKNAQQLACLEEVKRMNESYMEMAIKDDDLHVLQMVYTLHKQGISSEHPRFGFRRPVRVAAAHGGLNILKWLSEQKEKDEWLQDEWLLDAALKSCKMEIVQWVHETYMPRWRTSVRWKALDEIAVHGTQELLQWALTTLPDAQLTTNAMDGAAANSHLKIVEYLHSERTEGCTTEAMNNAAGNGHLAVVEYLHTHRQEGCTVRAMNDAASHGHLDIVKYLHEKRGRLYDQGYGPSCGKRTFRRAEKGALDVLKYLHENRSEGCTSDAIINAVLEDHVEVVRFLVDHCDVAYPDTAILYATRIGNWEMLELLFQANTCENIARVVAELTAWGHLDAMKRLCELTETSATNYIQLAAGNGHWRGFLDVIRFLQEKSEDAVEMGADHAMEKAAEYGHHHVVKFLYPHCDEDAYHATIDAPARGGQLRILKFLRENGRDGCTTLAMDAAAGKGFFPVVKYLCENRTEGCTKNAMDSAIRNKDLTMVKYLHQHYRVGFHEAVHEKAVEKDPEDLGLVQAYLRPDVLKEEKTRAAFLRKTKFERMFKRGRFAPEERAKASPDYKSGEESDAWSD